MDIHINSEMLKALLENRTDERINLVIESASDDCEPAEGFLEHFSVGEGQEDVYLNFLDEKDSLLETIDALRVNGKKLEETCDELRAENRSLRFRIQMANAAFNDLFRKYTHREKVFWERFEDFKMEEEDYDE